MSWKKLIEKLKWRWFLETHEHDWKYGDKIEGCHYIKGAYITRTCRNERCRQIETIYVSPNYDSLKQPARGEKE